MAHNAVFLGTTPDKGGTFSPRNARNGRDGPGAPCQQNHPKNCIIHSWRLATTGGLCRLCIRQADMKRRWIEIRKAFAAIQRFTRKSSAAAKAASMPAAKTQWEVSIIRTASFGMAAEGMRLLVVINGGQGA